MIQSPNLRRVRLNHQGQTFDFTYREDTLSEIETSLHKAIARYFDSIARGEYPTAVFNDRNARISITRMKGLSKSQRVFLTSKLIEGNLIRRQGEAASELPSYVQKVRQTFKEMKLPPPNHFPILNNLLITDARSLAVEIPVFSLDPRYSGHIDLLQYSGTNEIAVLDYKSETEDQFITFIPQVSLYAITLFKLIFTFGSLFKYKCVIFNDKAAWSFDPIVVIDFIEPLLTRFNVNTLWIQHCCMMLKQVSVLALKGEA